MCYKGRFVAWELKTEKGRATKLQKYELDSINKAGGIARIVTPSTFQQALEELCGIE